MTEQPQGRAPMGPPAEAEVPQHTDEDVPDGGRGAHEVLEDTPAYGLAAEDGTPLPPGTPGPLPADGDASPAAAQERPRGDGGPEFRAPGD